MCIRDRCSLKQVFVFFFSLCSPVWDLVFINFNLFVGYYLFAMCTYVITCTYLFADDDDPAATAGAAEGWTKNVLCNNFAPFRAV